jgi:hypothetical protein
MMNIDLNLVICHTLQALGVWGIRDSTAQSVFPTSVSKLSRTTVRIHTPATASSLSSTGATFFHFT